MKRRFLRHLINRLLFILARICISCVLSPLLLFTAPGVVFPTNWTDSTRGNFERCVTSVLARFASLQPDEQSPSIHHFDQEHCLSDTTSFSYIGVFKSAISPKYTIKSGRIASIPQFLLEYIKIAQRG